MGYGHDRDAWEEGDTTANAAKRIKAREAAVATAWRTFVYNNDRNPTIYNVAEDASVLAGESLGREFCARICEVRGYALTEGK
jgi:hypothetical protein